MIAPPDRLDPVACTGRRIEIRGVVQGAPHGARVARGAGPWGRPPNDRVSPATSHPAKPPA